MGNAQIDTVLPQKAVNCQLGGLEATEAGKDGKIHITMIQVALAKLVLRFLVETIVTHVLLWINPIEPENVIVISHTETIKTIKPRITETRHQPRKR